MKILIFSFFLLFSFVSKAEENPKPKILIAEYGEYPLYASLYVAEAAGFFKNEGLEVTIVPAGGDEKVFAALVSGNAQFGVSDPIFTAIAGEKGKPGKVIAGLLNGIPAAGVTFDKNIPEITSPEMLKSYKVGTFPAPSTSYSLQKEMFAKAGLKENIIQIQYGALLAGLKAKKIDIALENEPNVSLAESQGARVLYTVSKDVPEFAFTGLMSLPEYIEKNRELVGKVVSAFVQANKYIFSNENESVDILSKRFSTINKEVLRKAIQRVKLNNIIKPELKLTKAAWSEAVKMRMNLGDLKSEAKFEDYVDNSFLEK